MSNLKIADYFFGYRVTGYKLSLKEVLNLVSFENRTEADALHVPSLRAPHTALALIDEGIQNKLTLRHKIQILKVICIFEAYRSSFRCIL